MSLVINVFAESMVIIVKLVIAETKLRTCCLLIDIYQLHLYGHVSLCHVYNAISTVLQVADIIPPEVESSQATKSPELSTTQDPQSGSCTQSPRPSNLLTPREGGLISVMANMPQVKTTGVYVNLIQE